MNNTQNSRVEIDTKKIDTSEDKNASIKKALEEQLAYRNKVNKFYSNEKLVLKEINLKKKIEKAKSMNKKVFKVYQNHKEK